ncbi:glycosyltransferase family 4 protein [Rhodococcus ruber]|uniref:Glycosyltransferase family 4 protein n=1 Tax=Rhodococcus ruber TaxID=1830 RepID=A0ABT4MAQ7_9NOCA|nr:glycosyltransferase family 4 protein [Rhodococcus ruber]MCZ4518054.1 glycosyltransferase family 4 protein [Rhodococcus ruber]
MRIALAAPATLALLTDQEVPDGYPFSMTAYLALEYVKRGHEVIVVTTSPGLEHRIEIASEKGLKVVVVPSRESARSRALDMFREERRAISQVIGEINPDVVHAHWTYEFALAALSSGKPTVITVHDWAPAILNQLRDPYRLVRLFMQIRVLTNAAKITAPSIYIANRVRKYFRKECIVIPNGITMRSSAPIAVANPTVRRIGLLNVSDDARKNVGTAIDAWVQIREKYPEWILELAGPPYDPRNVGQVLKPDETGLQIHLRGAIDPNEINQWFDSIEIFLHPSLEESFGLVLVEAMSAGKPIIAGVHSGAVPEVVGEAGLLVNVNSTNEIASSIRAMIDSPELREMYSTLAGERAPKFDLEHVADIYLAELAAATNRTPGSY